MAQVTDASAQFQAQLPVARMMSFGQMLEGERAYVMPSVQRPFEWEESQVSLLLNDLDGALSAGYPFYFLGHIVAVPRADGAMEVVDGQQRLATISILIAYVRDRVQSNAPALADALQDRILTARGFARLTLRRRDARFFQSRVQTPGNCLVMARTLPKKNEATIPVETDAQELIWQAARTIHARLERYAGDRLAQFARFLLDHAVVGFITAPHRSAAAILFRGMNDRGRDLSPADLMKLETIEQAGLPDAALDEAVRSWEDCEDTLGRRRFADLLELLPLIITGKALRHRSSLSEWKDTLFSSIDPETLLTQTLPQLGEITRQLLNGEVSGYFKSVHSALGRDVERWVRCLLLLQDREWWAAAVYAFWRHGDDPQYLHAFFKRLDRLAFACFLEGADADVWERRIGGVIRQGDEPASLFSNFGAFVLDARDVSKLINRMSEPFKRESWRRRAVAFRADAALGGQAYLNAAQLTLEHIAPSKHGKKWEAEGWSAADTSRSAHLLGNFALLTEPQNQQASGKLFFEKRAIYFETPGAPVQALTKDVERYKTWTPTDVRARTELLAAALLQEWDLLSVNPER
jgi:hypothetical protein